MLSAIDRNHCPPSNGMPVRHHRNTHLAQGQPDLAGTIHRVPAVEIERVVADAVQGEYGAVAGMGPRALITAHVCKVEVQPDQLAIELTALGELDDSDDGPVHKLIYVPWQKPPSKRRREILSPPRDLTNESRPIRADARARLIAAIAQGRRWLAQLTTGDVTNIETIAKRERCSVRKINMTISLAFLAPDLVKAAIDGRLPRGIGFARLCDPPPDWSVQHRNLGLTPRQI